MRKLKYREVGQFIHSHTTNEWCSWDLSPGSLAPGEGNGNPLQCSCLDNPGAGGDWWAAVSGVTQSQTRLKWPSSAAAAVWLQSSMLLTLILCCQPVVHTRVGFICHWQLGVDHCCWEISVSTDEHGFAGAFAVLCILVSVFTRSAYQTHGRGVSSGVSEPDSNASFSTFWWYDCSSSSLCLNVLTRQIS